MEGVDYAWARPDVKCLYDSGRRFVVRYVNSASTSGKILTPSEATSIKAAGLDLVAVYQTSAGFMISNRDAGITAAHRAHDGAVACGMPATRPIYFALDTDPAGINSSEWAAVEAFLSGVHSVLGKSRTGVYGGYAAIERLVPNHATYGWQTYAWSGGKVSAKGHLYQYSNGHNICGGEVDKCKNLQADFGQWKSAGGGSFLSSLSDAQQAAIYHHISE